jgi:syndecan 4
VCYGSYFGSACDQQHCPGAHLGQRKRQHSTAGIPRDVDHVNDYVECNGNGTCDTSTGTCSCKGKFTGPDCGALECPKTNEKTCNNEGSCEVTTGKCVCKPGFYGDSCGKKHCPNVRANAKPEDRDWIDSDFVQCNGHGSCNLTTGTCTCATRWYMEDCSRRTCPAHQSRTCNDQGTCDVTRGECQCTAPFYGDACEKKHCPDYDAVRKVECHGNGICDATTGVCACDKSTNPYESGSWYGPSCNLRARPFTKDAPGLVCQGHGTCNTSTGTCTCYDDYWGDNNNCPYRHCPGWRPRYDPQHVPNRVLTRADFMECLDRGICDKSTGACTCRPEYEGPMCERFKCPVRNSRVCGGDGTCDVGTGKCVCNAGFYGDDCGSRRCPLVAGMECAGHGSCDKNTGMCSCLPGFSNVDCSAGVGVKHSVVCDGTEAAGC